MSVAEASDSDNMQVKINLVDKQTKNEDEQVEELNCSDMPEFSDPAILAVRENPKIKYTRDELFKLRDAPLSQKKPDFFNMSDVSSSVFDPERWNFERKKSTTPTENGPRNADGTDHRNQRRTGDPRERIRKENNDGIVLSPQRRSFNSGCFVPGRSTRPHSPLGKNDTSHIGVRDIQSGSRRIGSGRILRDSWDFNDKSEPGDNDYAYNRGQQQRNNDRDDKYSERRSFGRDFDMNRDKEKDNRRNNGRYNDRRRISSESKEEEPEWFSSGPSSQNDTIELRGFDEPEKGSNKKKISPQRSNKRYKDWKKKSIDTQPLTEEEDDRITDGNSPTPQVGEDQEGPQKSSNQHLQKNKDVESDNNEKSTGDQAYSFDDILKCDTIAELLTNGDGSDGDNSKSRFSHWFKRESPIKDDSRRSSLQDDHQIIKDLLNDIEPSVSIPPGDTDSYFAPISPAANTSGSNIGNKNTNQQGSIILEMLHRGKPQSHNDFESIKPPMGGNILNVDELESKMIQSFSHVNIVPQKQQTKHDDEMAAFKKLLAQANIGLENQPKQPSQPMTLLEMLNHSQQQDEARAANAARLLGTASPSLQMPHQNDINIKLQQAAQKQQLDMFNQLMNPNIHAQMRSSPLPDISLQQQSRELLNRPEAQAILQGLKRGEITTQHLYQQLSNHALQSRHRDMLITILKLQSAGGGGIGPSPRVLSPVPPPHMFQQQQQQQQQQQLRVSPLPPNAYCVSPILATSPNTLTVPAMHQRIPSPRELQVHTQKILQRALIKKKLEEQQENYRKKQEMQQRGQSPNTNNNQTSKSVSSPTQFAFTPTSVLRKMTAEKDEGKDAKSVNDSSKVVPQGRPVTGMKTQTQQPQPVTQWNQQQYMMKQPPGRPIVKANNNYSTSQAEQFMFQQQQQQQQQRLYNAMSNQTQPQQRKSSTSTQNNIVTQYQLSGSAVNISNGPGVPPPSHSHYTSNQQFPQQLTQQQLRAQHQQQARPANQQPQQQLNFHQNNQQQQQPVGAWQQFINSTQQNNRSNNTIGRGGINDGDRSPTSNQLSRWFSPDLLERARGGELPSTAGLTKPVLSLEEIERQTAPPVHN